MLEQVVNFLNPWEEVNNWDLRSETSLQPKSSQCPGFHTPDYLFDIPPGKGSTVGTLLLVTSRVRQLL